MLLDDMILDVTQFVKVHPGGRFVLQRCFGTDISKFFYGGYSLELPKDGGFAHAHSNIAKEIVRSLVIAKLH